MSHEEARAAIATAVGKARELRGTVSLHAAGLDHLWCAASAAPDGRLHVNVGEPRRGWRRWDRSAETRLEGLGLVHTYDAWTIDFAPRASTGACAATVLEAMEAGLGWEGEPLDERFVFAGIGAAGAPPPDAPHEEHVAAAMRSLILDPTVSARISSGFPSRLWAYVVHATPGALTIQRDLPGRPGYGEDVWEVPATDEEAAKAAAELVRRMAADVPGLEAEPLFIELMAQT